MTAAPLPVNGNGKGSWIAYLNTLLILIVGALLSMFISSNDKRISKLEDEWQSVALVQAARGSRIDTIENELRRLRSFHER